MSRWRLLLILGIALWIGLLAFSPPVDFCYFCYDSKAIRQESYRIKKVLREMVLSAEEEGHYLSKKANELIPGLTQICATGYDLKYFDVHLKKIKNYWPYKVCNFLVPSEGDSYFLFHAKEGIIPVRMHSIFWMPSGFNKINGPCYQVSQKTYLNFYPYTKKNVHMSIEDK